VEETRSERNLPYKFTGKELDPETGLYYFGARYYDPVVSVWASPDPIDRFGPHSPPTALNLYQYTLLNPIRLLDPTGLEEEESQSLWSNIKQKASEWVGNKVKENVSFTNEEAYDSRRKQYDELGIEAPPKYGEGAEERFGEVAEWGTNKSIEIGEEAAIGKGLSAVAGSVVTYREGKQLTKGLKGEQQAHKLVEARHLKNWGRGDEILEAPAIVLPKGEHQAVTNVLRQKMEYGSNWTKEQALKVYQEAYQGMTGAVDAVKEFINK
jgi:RHS repeat-associated protein